MTEREIELEKSKNFAYWERNQLVCFLSKLYPAWLEKHPKEDKSWDDDWRNIVFVQLPTGQASWHIHESEYNNFRHLPVREINSWDGHSTEEKYDRLSSVEIKRPNLSAIQKTILDEVIFLQAFGNKMNVREAARKLNHSPSLISYTINRLIKMGYIADPRKWKVTRILNE